MDIDSDKEEKKAQASILKAKKSIDVLSESKCCLRKYPGKSDKTDSAC